MCRGLAQAKAASRENLNSKLSEDFADELIYKSFESPDLDYKETFDDSTGAWMELAKDIYAMANFGGGCIVLGVKDGTFTPVGMDLGFRKDTQDWVDKISKWATGNVDLSYAEYTRKISGTDRKFPIIEVHPSIGNLLVPKVEGTYTDRRGLKQTAFRLGVIYTRKTTSSVAATGDDFWEIFWALLKRTAEATGSGGTPLEVISALSQKAKPDSIEETLWSNLFPVTEIPDYIFSAVTDCRFPSDIYERVNEKFKTSDDSFIEVPSYFLADRRIFSFIPFDSSNPISVCVTGQVEKIPTKDWMNDSASQQRLIMLLNYNLKDLCRRRGFFFDAKNERYHMRYFGGTVPSITWKPYKKTSTRPFVYVRVRADGQLSYCEHFGGRLRFIMLGAGIYLVIEPIRVLTRDGESPLDQRRKVTISTKASFRYHNNNYLYDTKLWLQILAGNSQEIHLGSPEYRTSVSILPITSKANFGISDDQYTSEDFLDELKSEPFEYVISTEETAEDNPLTETSLEE